MTNAGEAAGNRLTRWRSIALPIEHGGWGFTLEPALLGLMVAYSAAAWELAVASIAVFLARRPTKLVLTDLVRRRWLPRSRIALGFALGYGAVAALGLAGALVTAASPFWQPLLIALPLAAIALYADARSQSRGLIPELAGAVAMGATVTMIALADGWTAGPAWGLWLVLTGRAVATVVLVRGQIRRVHGRPAGDARIYAVQAGTVVVMGFGAAADIVPWLSVAAMVGVAVVAYWSLSRPPVQAKTVGWTQIVVGLLVVVLTAVGVWVGW
jgi:hypothetical protein